MLQSERLYWNAARNHCNQVFRNSHKRAHLCLWRSTVWRWWYPHLSLKWAWVLPDFSFKNLFTICKFYNIWQDVPVQSSLVAKVTFLFLVVYYGINYFAYILFHNDDLFFQNFHRGNLVQFDGEYFIYDSTWAVSFCLWCLTFQLYPIHINQHVIWVWSPKKTLQFCFVTPCKSPCH